MLLFVRLGDSLLWQDEAQTALIAETVLQHGVPLGFDGKNYFSMEKGLDYGRRYLWRYHPWLQFYLTAASFAVLGKGSFSARLPFALLGLATIFLLYFYAKRLGGSIRSALLACALLSICVPFLLLARQCRYYSAASFLTLLGLHSYSLLLEDRRGSDWLLAISAVLLFYSHYLYYGVLIGTILADLALFQRQKAKPALRALAFSIPWILPGALWHATMPYGSIYSLGYRDPAVAAGLLFWFIRDIFRYIIPLPLMALAAFAFLFEIFRSGRSVLPTFRRYYLFMPPILWMSFNLVALSLFSTEYYFRYLAPAIPLLCLGIAIVADRLWELHPLLGSLGILLFLIHQPIRDYLYELTHHYIGPMDGYVGYLLENAKPTDVVWATLEDLPIKFYTPLRVVSSMTGEDLSKAPKPDWLVFRRFAYDADDVAARAFIKRHLNRNDFEEIRLHYPDIAFQNREDPEHHKFRTVLEAPPIVIYRRKVVGARSPPSRTEDKTSLSR